MIKLIEMDPNVSMRAQLADDVEGQVVLLNVITVAPEDAEELLASWATGAAWMKKQPGFISTQLHRGIAGSSVFMNYAVWESIAHFRAAFTDPEFRTQHGTAPASAVASPHLIQKVAVPGICGG